MARLIWLLILCSTVMLGASSYCAYQLTVRNPSGAPFANVPVGMVEQQTQRVTAITDTNGLARFCDAPLHPVDFVVGVRECGVALVKGVKFSWPETRNIFITYDTDHCSGEFIFPNSCQVLLRIHDEKGRPIAGAVFDSGPAKRDVSDVFGRIFRTLKSGENLKGVLKKEGREPTHVSQPCVRDGERDTELKVVLRKAGK